VCCKENFLKLARPNEGIGTKRNFGGHYRNRWIRYFFCLETGSTLTCFQTGRRSKWKKTFFKNRGPSSPGNKRQGCQIDQNPILGKFWRDLQRNIWYILWTFGLFYGHLIHFVVISVYFSPFWFVVPRKLWQPREAASWSGCRCRLTGLFQIWKYFWRQNLDCTFCTLVPLE
jgi:hypothetical protein